MEGGSAPEMGRELWSYADALLPWAIVVLLLPWLFSNCVAWGNLILFPAEINFGEGIVRYEAIRLSQGEPIYKPANEAPYWFGVYPPLYQWILSLGGSSFGFARSMSLASSLFSAVILGLMVGLGTRRAGAGLVAAMLWLVSPFTAAWCIAGRVDMLGRALESAAIALVFFGRGRPAFTAAAVAAAALAMFTKQTMIAGGIAAAGILLAGSWRRAAVFGAAWAVVVLGGYGILSAATGGWFWRNVLGDVGRDLDAGVLRYFAGQYLVIHAVMLPACAVGIAGMRRGGPAWAFGISALAGLPSVLMSANDGADVNYYFDLHWGLCGLAGCGLAALPGQVAAGRRAAGAVLALGAAAAAILLAPPIAAPTRDQREMAERITSDLRKEGLPVLCEFTGYTLAAGGEPDIMPYMYRQLEDSGRWDPAPIADKLRRQEYKALLLTSRETARWGRGVLEAVVEAYRPVRRYTGTYIIEGPDEQVLWLPMRKL